MRAPDAGAVLARRLHDWFGTPLGRSLQACEVNRLREILPQLFGPVALQLGRIGDMDMLETSLAASHVVLEQAAADAAPGACVRGYLDALPFDSRSVDVVLLPHTLDFADDPHAVLREVNRVLVPEGHVVIIGFNPFSLWGLWRLFARRAGRMPWCGRFIRLARVKDWLQLLGFDIARGCMLYYRPPVRRQPLRDRLLCLESAGDRWWPMFAAVYIVVAKKCELGMTPLRPVWKTQQSLAPGLAEPVARGMRRHGSS